MVRRDVAVLVSEQHFFRLERNAGRAQATSARVLQVVIAHASESLATGTAEFLLVRCGGLSWCALPRRVVHPLYRLAQDGEHVRSMLLRRGEITSGSDSGRSSFTHDYSGERRSRREIAPQYVYVAAANQVLRYPYRAGAEKAAGPPTWSLPTFRQGEIP
jgi:hypothetical protein